MTGDLAGRWRAACRTDLDEAVALRHALHAAPYVGGAEDPTTQAVVDWLGLDEGVVVAGTGRIVRVIEGAGRPVVLRAELDGLPIEEATGVAWASTTGAMHACGHDVHLAALGLVARAALRVGLPRPLWALLQPREEGADSGARDVVAEGALAGVGDVIGAHVQPRLAPGVVATTPGPVNAATDEFTLTLTGRGGHSGYPHTVADAVLALSATIVALQQVGARRIDPTVGVACMVNQVRAGTANNVVPGLATGSGTLRTMRAEDQATAMAAILDIATHTAQAHGCTAEVVFDPADPVLVNDAALAVRAGEVLAGLHVEVDPAFRSFGSDDFACYGPVARSLMLFVGTGSAHGGLHDPTYLPDDRYVGRVADALVAGYCAAVSS